MSHRTARTAWQRCGVAIGASVLGLALALSLRSLGDVSVFPVFLAVVVFTTWFGGLGAGLLATALAVLAIDYYFEVPLNSLAITSADTVLNLVVFAATAVLVGLLMDHLQLAERLAASAQADAERSRNELSQLLDRMIDGVFGLDLNDRATIVYTNGRATQILLQGTPAANTDLVGRPIGDVLQPELRAPFESAYRRAWTARVPARFHVQCGQPPRWLEFSLYPAADGISVHCRDVTEQKEQEQQLLGAERREGRLEGAVVTAREIVHLLGNDINAAYVVLELLHTRPDIPAAIAELAGHALTQLRAAADHLDMLRHVVRVETRDTPGGPALDLSRSVEPPPPGDDEDRGGGATTRSSDSTR